MALTKTASSTNLLVGSNLTYTIDVMNLSTVAVTGVAVTDTLPVEVRFLSSSPPATETNGLAYTFDLGTLATGAVTSIVIQTAVTSTVPETITNRAVATLLGTELTLSNNIDSATTILPDSDNDGIANPTDPDNDNDGVSDENELIANTDPFDPNSFLWVRIMKSGTNDVQQLTFPTSTGRTYQIESTPSLYTNDWTIVFSNLPGLGIDMTILHTNPADRVYYRIGVQSP
ncbi:MAG: hypothetical protein AAF492_28515 [Verrucomicrobiota bacterium]